MLDKKHTSLASRAITLPAAPTSVTGNAGTATKLATARTIAINGGATGTATSFNGDSNITIPVTGLNMDKANAGILSLARGGTGGTTQSAAFKNIVAAGGTFTGGLTTTNTGYGALKFSGKGSGMCWDAGWQKVYCNDEGTLHIDCSYALYVNGIGTYEGTVTYKPVHASAFNVASSKRYKENIVEMTDEQAKQTLKMRPVMYDYINGDKSQFGMVAEDNAGIQEQGLARNQKGEPEGLDYAKFVPQLIKLCQIQQKTLDMQQVELDSLKARVTALENKMVV